MFQSMLKKAGQVKISRARKAKSSSDGGTEEPRQISLQTAEEICVRHLKTNDQLEDGKDSESTSGAQSIQQIDDNVEAPTPDPMKSRLSKTRLIDVIRDNYCLSHFVQYLETTGSLVSLKFWMDADNFQIAALNLEAKHATPNNHESEMERPLTDDEKSELCVKNKKVEKRTTKCYKTSLRDDAFRIYDTYFGYRDMVGLPKTVLAQITSRLRADKAEAAAEAKELRMNGRNDNEDNKSISSRTSDSGLEMKCIETSDETNIDDKMAKPKESLKLLSALFQEAQSFVFQRLERDHLNKFTSSNFFSKYEIEILTDCPTIDDILYSESALFYFMEYLEQQGERSLLDFYMSAINFHKQHRHRATFNKEAAQKDALVLYEKYFSLQAHNPIGMSESVRAQIEQDICSIEDDEHIIETTFEFSRSVVRYYLNRRHFPVFLDSSMFLRYLTELTTKLDQVHAPPATSTQLLRRSQSECSHRKTKSDGGMAKASRNTLLAMESSGAKMRSCEGTMQIDSRQLSQPDLLWQRRKSTGDLSFGRVNALGRYERQYGAREVLSRQRPISQEALVSGGYGQWSLKRAVKRLVNLTEDDEEQQEVLAWQVAGMIVNDVMSVTMADKVATSRARYSTSD